MDNDGGKGLLRVVGGLLERVEEGAHVDGAAGLEIDVVRHLRVAAVALVVGRHGDDFLNRLADAPVFQRLGLLEPLLADAGGGLHAVAVAQLLLGRVLAGQFAGQRAGRVKADLVLRDIEAHGGDLARVVQLQRAHGRVDGHAAGLVGLSARAGHGAGGD